MYKKLENNNKIINYVCKCKNNFYNDDKLVSLLPCNHLIHESCISNHIIKTINKLNNKIIIYCPMCNIEISSILKENKILTTNDEQLKIDIQSVRLNTNTNINYSILPIALVKITSFINKLLLVNSKIELLNTLEYLLRICNIKINVIDNTKNNPIKYINNTIKWKNKKDINEKKVLISNHTHYFDSFILFYLFKSGFVSSDFINKTNIGKLIVSKCNLLIFKRGKDINMVEKIKEYLEEEKIITIYPEGVMGNPNTLLRFRTGAFYIGAPVCPIIIKYHPYVWDDDIQQLIYKLITQPEIIIDVYINDLIYPPFDNIKINKIREFMANIGNLKLSRVSNKDIME